MNKYLSKFACHVSPSSHGPVVISHHGVGYHEGDVVRVGPPYTLCVCEGGEGEEREDFISPCSAHHMQKHTHHKENKNAHHKSHTWTVDIYADSA